MKNQCISAIKMQSIQLLAEGRSSNSCIRVRVFDVGRVVSAMRNGAHQSVIDVLRNTVVHIEALLELNIEFHRSRLIADGNEV